MKIRANAKINLFLDIMGKRKDGYHELLTVFQEISLSDILRIRPARQNRIRGVKSIGPGNTLGKSLELLAQTCSSIPGLDIRLEKRIPMGAGLGGGSSDAASLMRSLNRKFHLGLKPEHLEEVACLIGCDVPFFLHGGCQVGRERGDQLEIIRSKVFFYVVVVFPGFSVSTEEAYGMLDPSEFGKGEKKFRRMIGALKEGDRESVADSLYNIFESVVLKQYPSLIETRKVLKGMGALGVLLSGSGSSMFGLFGQKKEAHQCMFSLKARYPAVFLSETIL